MERTGILAKDQIKAALASGEIVVSPLEESQIGVASIDLTLANEFRYYTAGPQRVIEVDENTDYKTITEKVTLKDGETFMLLPGQSCLGITSENVKLSPGICALLEGRSRFARLGLFVHITAGFIQPGINNQQVLEIYNASLNALALKPGTRVCQMVFMRMAGEAQYQGKYNQQTL
eukprot:TRINITY_DN3185_c0_g1_i3.p1 TRINITY_DN3185_c0_g1~~TRINITY_DN3185_c0_g1_i3.p1  ORF type:complete len:176 (+),score=35.50 TRINITY_DN3185_c0_g1_i3:69-596(+)